MFKRRVFAVVCSLCLVCSTLSGVAYGAGSLDDILQGADPWEDFKNVSNVIQSIGNSVPSSVDLDDGLWVGNDDGSSMESPSPMVGEDESGEEGVTPYILPTERIRYFSVYPGITYGSTNSSSLPVTWYRVDGSFAPSKRGLGNRTDQYYTLSSLSFNYANSPNKPALASAGGFHLDYFVENTSDDGFWNSTTQSVIKFAGRTFCRLDFQYISTVQLYPVAVQLIINGKPVGKKYAIEDNTPPMIAETVSLSGIGVVNSYGYRFYFSPFFYKFSSHSTSACYVKVAMNDGVVATGSQASTGDVVGSVDQTTEAVKETNGLLGGLIELVRSIASGLGTIVQSIGNIVTAIAGLPDKIWTAISDGLQLLFVPSTDELDAIHDKWKELCETKFGFVYQSYQMLENVWSTLIGGWASHKDYTFRFPGISFDMLGETYHVVEPQVIDFDNQLMAVLRAPLGTIVSIVCVLGAVNLFEHMFFAFISGKSYFDFLRGGGGEE